MIERVGDIFNQTDADALCVTTNGIVNNGGALVMGAGVAFQFKKRWPDLPYVFGDYVSKFGNHVYATMGCLPKKWIVSFPTKHHWRAKSDLKLIEQSAKELVVFADKEPTVKKVYLPRPGAGLGELNWEMQVKPAIINILDDKFIILSF